MVLDEEPLWEVQDRELVLIIQGDLKEGEHGRLVWTARAKNAGMFLFIQEYLPSMC